jgi:hypothetical protein
MIYTEDEIEVLLTELMVSSSISLLSNHIHVQRTCYLRKKHYFHCIKASPVVHGFKETICKSSMKWSCKLKQYLSAI